MNDPSGGLYIQMHSMHGLFRGRDLELGRDEDTGGQITYVLNLAVELGNLEEVSRVDIVTRMIRDPDYPGYSDPVEPVTESVNIVRIPCGGDRYIKKVHLWPFLEEFVENTRRYLEEIGRPPDILHSNYADSGLVCVKLSQALDIPQVHTGHSLGRPKMECLGVSEETFAEMDEKFNFALRLRAEQEVIDRAARIVVSTRQERDQQYRDYEIDMDDPRFAIIPPGADLDRFYHYLDTEKITEADRQASRQFYAELAGELADPEKPLIYNLGRLAPRKNVPALVHAYGDDAQLQELANLVIAGGTAGKDAGEEARSISERMSRMVAAYGIEEKVFLRKAVDFETEAPEYYRVAARSGGVFINPALIEPFGLTIVEASACGLPVVATENGGPQDIISHGENGFLVNVEEPEAMAEALGRLLADQDLWEQFSRAGRENAIKHYTWSGMAKKELELFLEVLSEKGAPGRGTG